MSNWLQSICRWRYLLVFSMLMVMLPNTTNAQSFEFGREDFEIINTGQLVEIPIHLQNLTQEPINGISATVVIPRQYFDFEDYWLGESLITLWVQDPEVQETENSYIISLAGLIPGGTSDSGPLITLVLRPTRVAKRASLSISRPVLYMHSAQAEERRLPEQFLFLEITSPDAGRAPQRDVVIKDTVPPEDFFPIIGKNRTLYDNAYFVMFQAIDRQTGIDRYELLESPDFYEDSELDTLYFRPAHNPERLQDQTLSSYVYVRVYDRAGNSRTVIIPPTTFVEKRVMSRILSIVSALCLLGVGLYVVTITRQRRRSSASHEQ